METVSIVRLGIALIATLAFLFFAIRINDDWKDLTRGWKVTRISSLGLILVAVFGSIELMLVEPPVPLGARNFLLFGFLVGILVGLYMVRHDPPPVLKADTACTFPGCIVARKDLRAAAEKYPLGIPPHIVIAIVDGVEAHEHHK